MSEQQPKKHVVEWSFSFDQLNQRIGEQIRNMGVSINNEPVKTAQFNEPIGSATSARVELALSIGLVTANALSGSDNLMESEVRYTGEMQFEVSGDTTKSVKLSQKRTVDEDKVMGPIKEAIGKFVNRNDLRWTIGLTPNIPLALKIAGGVGECRLDLTDVQLTNLELDGGVGETHLTLPAGAGHYTASLKSGVGAANITIVEGASVELSIDSGVGSVAVQLPPGAAVRVEATSGLGGIHLPDHFKRTKGGDDFISKSGVWETEGYSLAAHQISIRFNGGVGGLKIS